MSATMDTDQKLSDDNLEPALKRARVDEKHSTTTTTNGVAGAPVEYTVKPEFLQSLLSLKVQYFVPSSNIVFVAQRTDRVVDVWRGLVRHNFLAVSVLQKHEHAWYGFLDLSDIVGHVVKQFGQEKLRETEAFWARVEAEKTFENLLVQDLMQYPISRRNPFHPVKEGYSLLHAIEIMAREDHCHRVPVITGDEHRQLRNMITQSQVIQYLFKQEPVIGSRMKRPLSDCNVVHEVLSVNEDSLAIDAFTVMAEKGVQGIAVVDSEGRLMGNLSVRDLKCVGYDLNLFWRLYQTVKNFVIKLRKDFQERDERPHHVLYATPETTVGEALQMLAVNNVHRVYVVNNKKDRKPIGVVTLRDVLLQIIN